MKTRVFAIVIIGIVAASGSAYLYDQMHDCLNPPLWIKFPRSYGVDDCMRMYYDGTLPDWSDEREKYSKEQAHREEMIELFSDIPEVVGFYEKYNDANVSVRNDHVSYFAGKESGFQSRMNLHYDEKNELTHMEFYCFNKGSVQYEVAPEDITYYLENKNCNPNTSENRTLSKWDFRKEPPYVIIPLGAVLVGNEHLIPKEIIVVLGKNNTITWINEDDVPHTLVSDNGGDEIWSTGMMKSGESSSVTFNRTGVFDYHGTPGPWITGTVTVLEE